MIKTVRYKDQLFIFGGASTQRGSNRYNNELVRYDPGINVNEYVWFPNIYIILRNKL